MFALFGDFIQLFFDALNVRPDGFADSPLYDGLALLFAGDLTKGQLDVLDPLRKQSQWGMLIARWPAKFCHDNPDAAQSLCYELSFSAN
jgi:hypothetical protein